MQSLTFESILQRLKTELPEILGNTEAYLVSNIYSRFALYLVNPPTDLIKKIQNQFQGILEEVENINTNEFIYTDLQIGKEEIPGNSIFFFVNRHADKTNWYLSQSQPINLQAKVVAFYSFKGGLGRTTSLVLSAIQLARLGKKVALIDFDLEAPGLSSLFLSDFPQYAKVRGVTDYILDLATNNYQTDKLDLADYYFSLNQQDLVGKQAGELLVFPATYSESSNSHSLNYIDKLSKITLQYDEFQENYGPDTLLSAIDAQLKPDFILIDTRTGVNDIGGLVFHRYAHLSFLFFYGNQQNMFGLDAVLEKIKGLVSKFYLVNSPVPREEKTQDEEISYFLETSYQIFSELYYEEGKVPDLQDTTADHYPINILYNDTAAFLNSTRKLRSLLEERGSENPYVRMANLMLAETEIYTNDTSGNVNTSRLVKAISSIIDETAASETEFLTEEDLGRNFYPRSDYRFIFDRGKFLILGEKGSGKTALYAVLSHDNYAKELAQFCESNNDEWRNTTWIKGLDTTENFPSQTNFRTLKDLTDNQLRNYWLILLCREVASFRNESIPDVNFAELSHFRELAKDDFLSERLESYIQKANQELRDQGQFLTVVYDYLDRQLTEEENLRGRLVGALLGLWYEYQNRFSNLRAKIFLRKDIYEREIPTGLTDKVKLDNFKQEIEWEQTQLLDMVWKRILEQDPEAVLPFLQSVCPNFPIDQRQRLGYIPAFPEEQHSQLLAQLFGKRMGGNNKAFPYKWIEQHIADTHRNIQPRSILNLFGLGAKRQIGDPTPSLTPIRAFNFENELAEVSKRRVRDLEEEYPNFKPVFEDLSKHLDKFPVAENPLKDAIKDIISTHIKLRNFQPEEIVNSLMNMGVLYEYKYNKKNVGLRYHIPDLYLFGLGLSRFGPGAHKAMFKKGGRV